LGFGEIIYAKIKILGIGVVSAFREVWVQLLITGGVGSNVTNKKGIFGNCEELGADLN